jgi:hypothetical protein
MSDKAIVVDTNILIRAVWGKRWTTDRVALYLVG